MSAVSRRRAPAAVAAGKPATVVAAAEAPVASGLTIVEIAALCVAAIVVVAAARVAEAFLVPVISGILLSYALRPLVSRLESWRLPRAVAAVAVILVLVGLVSGAGYVVRNDVNEAVAQLPAAARKVRIAIADATRLSPGPISHVKAAAAELDKAAAVATGKPEAADATPKDDVAAQFQSLVSRQSEQAMTVVSELVLAILLAFFLLAAGDTFRRKVAHLAGESLARRRVTVEVLNQIDSQIQAYLLTLLATNVLVALVTWGVLVAFGLPNAGMWAVFTGVLHVVPYAGTAIAGAGIGIATFVHSGSLAQAAGAMAVVAGIATLIGVGFTTWLQGRTSRMNAVAVFIGVLFFGWLWGGWGLLLGLPILAVVRSVCDRVEALHPVSELLAD